MERTAKLWLKRTAGVILILLGVVSGLVPVVQGWLLILIGLYLLEVDWVKGWIEKLKEKREKRRAKRS